ncbi:hypothetical protein F5878DRAFT_10318 [Lentinula raphanica]|uniref:Uncharacterized protein n=1 Tax=Lentinula raphanica TaxID=153919 RepID=A0AA38NXE0_9AGAR|nr:hypothetical protein F5878DRAFT_10318 [Lentinula raphanica]
MFHILHKLRGIHSTQSNTLPEVLLLLHAIAGSSFNITLFHVAIHSLFASDRWYPLVFQNPLNMQLEFLYHTLLFCALLRCLCHAPTTRIFELQYLHPVLPSFLLLVLLGHSFLNNQFHLTSVKRLT